jgi:hypothetical protein
MESPSHPLMACIKHNPLHWPAQPKELRSPPLDHKRGRYRSTRSPRQRYQKAPAPHVYAADGREQPYRQATWASVQDSNPGTQGIPRHHQKVLGPVEASGHQWMSAWPSSKVRRDHNLRHLGGAGRTGPITVDMTEFHHPGSTGPTARYRHWGPRHDY